MSARRCCAVLCCAVLCCAVLCCAVLCCAVLCWQQACTVLMVGLCRAVLCCVGRNSMLLSAVLYRAGSSAVRGTAYVCNGRHVR
jgi:hypothetical protein